MERYSKEDDTEEIQMDDTPRETLQPPSLQTVPSVSALGSPSTDLSPTLFLACAFLIAPAQSP